MHFSLYFPPVPPVSFWLVSFVNFLNQIPKWLKWLKAMGSSVEWFYVWILEMTLCFRTYQIRSWVRMLYFIINWGVLLRETFKKEGCRNYWDLKDKQQWLWINNVLLWIFSKNMTHFFLEPPQVLLQLSLYLTSNNQPIQDIRSSLLWFSSGLGATAKFLHRNHTQ